MGRSLLILILLSCAKVLPAQSYNFTITDAAAAEGGFFTQGVELTVQNDVTVSGWAMSACHDATVADVCGAQLSPNVFALTPFNLFWYSVGYDNRATTIPFSTDGASMGVVIDQNGMFFFPSNSTLHVLDIFYVADPGTDGMTSTTTVCSAVGNPNVESVVVCCGGSSVPLGAGLSGTSGTVSYGPAVPMWTLSGTGGSVQYDVVTGSCLSGCTIAVDVTIANTPANTDLTDTAGFSLSLAHDASYLTPIGLTLGATPGGIEQAPTTPAPVLDCTLLGGTIGPDFVQMNIAGSGSGVSIEVQNTMFPPYAAFPYCVRTIDWGSGDTAFTVEYAVDTSSLAGNPTGTTTALTFTDIGDGVGNSLLILCPYRILYPLESLTTLDIVVDLIAVGDPDFIRGDCNSDTAVNIADVIWTIAGYLAMPTTGPLGQCAEACDANDDNNVDVGDIAFMLSYLFASGSPPTAPFPTCSSLMGVDCADSGCP
ncbi:MAG: dockerin type I repeat-containing protein [Planctomycetota bacterium]